MCVGGGSGGHITPVVAVIKELLREVPNAEIRFVCDRKFASVARELMPTGVRVSIVVSGKLRRYSNMKWYWHFEHIFRTHLRNVIDLFKVGIGLVQSLFKLIIWRPNVIFAKGGFVCLPVGLAASILRIPLVIHDSDTTPGLTNRILARFARAIGTGAPVENYPTYPKNRTHYVGIPLRPEFHILSTTEKMQGKKRFGFAPDRNLIVALGGGQGARTINDTVIRLTPWLNEKAQILVIAGKDDYQRAEAANQNPNLKVMPFVTDNLAELIGSADAVVSRAGATFLAELAAVAAPVILVPSPHLAGNHQMKNAAVYARKKAAIVVDEREFGDEARSLLNAINELLSNDKLRAELSRNLHKFSKPNATRDIAKLILEEAQRV